MTPSQKADLIAIAELNAVSFGADDYYSVVANVLYVIVMEDGAYYTIKEDGIVVGYILMNQKADGFHCVRRGVAPSAKNRGLGTKLSVLGVKHARKAATAFNTYMSVENYASMNSNIKAGLGIVKIDENWVYMKTY